MTDTRKMRLAGWSARGLRCPDYDIDLTNADGDTHKVTLLQMPNGTGKTTTLDLLRASLSGVSPNGKSWNDFHIPSLAKPGAKSGSFVTHLLIDGNKRSFTLNFDFQENEVEQLTTCQSTGQSEGFDVPRSLEPFLNPNFVRFIVFDGELAGELIDRDKQDAQRAIDAMFHLRTFRQMGQWADSYLKNRVDEQADAGAGVSTTKKGAAKKQTLVDSLSQRIAKLVALQNEAQHDLERDKARVLKLTNDNRKALEAKKEYQQSLTDATSEKHGAELQLQRLQGELLRAMRSPQNLLPAFAKAIAELREGFDRVRLPENTAREWFVELSEEELCICGRPLSDEERNHIRAHAHQYLGSSDVALLNQIKGAVAKQVRRPFSEADKLIRELNGKLIAANDALGKSLHAIEQIVESARQNDPEIDAKEKELAILRQSIAKVEEALRRFERPNTSPKPEHCFNIQELCQLKRREEKKLDEIMKTTSLRWKVLCVNEIVHLVYSKAVNDLGAALARTVNQSLTKLMPDNHVRLSGIERSLVFEGKHGVSMGETLTVAYAFLTHLSGSSNFSIPLIVDTPAAPIDPDIRAEIGRSIPALVDQFVAFIIAPERGDFTDSLAHASDGDIQFLTLFRRSNSRLLGRVDLSDPNVVLSEDGCLVRGREFFESFQDNSTYHRDRPVDGLRD